jgi:hypoxanthine phosphoribosyltransferase
MIIGKPLLTVDQIQQRIKELAGQIDSDYRGRELLAVGILKGAFMFFSDMVKHIHIPMAIDFLITSSYIKTGTTGDIQVHAHMREDVKDRHVLLIEDIIDTGLTMKFIRQLLMEKNPASLKVCTLLDKKNRRKVDVHIDYVGFEIPDEYVVGYGLDYDNKFRNLPYIAIFREDSKQSWKR